MNLIIQNQLLFLRRITQKLLINRHEFPIQIMKSNTLNQELIGKGLLGDKPYMVARFGSVEMNCLVNYTFLRNPLSMIPQFFFGRSDAMWWKSHVKRDMEISAGFFPSTDSNLTRFCELMLEDMKHVDIIGSWLSGEALFEKELNLAMKVPLADLEPYYFEEPWSYALKDKKVLVIHPFAESILSQFKNRELLFSNKKVLPDFELNVIKAVQTIAGEKSEFKDWFKALDFMKNQISNTDFDIAIIGCGAYGFPLAAHVKRMGLKAIHLGGATQLLFGVTGSRWLNHPKIGPLINKNWVFPLPSETPVNAKKVENACYW